MDYGQEKSSDFRSRVCRIATGKENKESSL
jgi:hypothetical protein